MAANEAHMDFSEVVMLLDQLNYALVNRQEDKAIALLASAPLSYHPDQDIQNRIEIAIANDPELEANVASQAS
jgi:hypothetical protein